jgi:hypothetical protein
MKATYNRKNMINWEFQHSIGSQLIEVMTMKMQMIQFVSIANLIRTRLIKMIHNVKNMTNKEIQYHMECEFSMISKNYESICDKQYQSKDYSQQQLWCSHFQSWLI